jgi:hypothetical protein
VTDESNLPLSEQYARIGARWVDAEAAASLMEQTKSVVLEQRVAALGDMPKSRAETIVKAKPEWEQFIKDMVELRRQANQYKVQMETLKMRNSEWIGESANRRVEAKL